MARPSPELAPVTIATLSCSRPIGLASSRAQNSARRRRPIHRPPVPRRNTRSSDAETVRPSNGVKSLLLRWSWRRTVGGARGIKDQDVGVKARPQPTLAGAEPEPRGRTRGGEADQVGQADQALVDQRQQRGQQRLHAGKRPPWHGGESRPRAPSSRRAGAGHGLVTIMSIGSVGDGRRGRRRDRRRCAMAARPSPRGRADHSRGP